MDLRRHDLTRRLFIAVFPPPAACDAASRAIEAMQRGTAARDVSWVKRANLHFTLRFLGDCDAPSEARAREAVGIAARAAAPFAVTLGAPGAFPNASRARVLWLGLAGGAAELRALATALEAALVTRGLGRADKPFVPHLTLGRVRNERGADCANALAAATSAGAGAMFEVREFALVASTLAPGGSRYEVLERAALAAGAAPGTA